MQVLDFLERPIVSYIIMGVFSVAAAVIFFLIGGSVAEVSGQEGTLIGVGFEAGGALAGFVIIFLLSLRVIDKLKQTTPEIDRLLREYILRARADSFDPTGGTLICRYMLFDTETGDWGEWNEISYVRAAGGLKIHVREMEPHHIIRVRLKDAQRNVWVSDDDYAYGVSPMHLERVDATQVGQRGR